MLRLSAFLYAATDGAAANRAQAIELCTFNARHQSGLSHYFLEAIAHPCATNLRVRLGLNLVPLFLLQRGQFCRQQQLTTLVRIRNVDQ